MRQAQSAKSPQDPAVAQLLTLLYANNRNEQATIINEMLKHMAGIEQQLNETTNQLKMVQEELKQLREERNYPVATLYKKAAQTLENKVEALKANLAELKNNIVEGAKNALNAVKEKRITALDKIASFFHIKPALMQMRKNLREDIQQDNRSIAKIAKISSQYHNAGMHVKNAGRALFGKQAVPLPKPNGKLAKMLQAPFRGEIKCMKKALRLVDSLGEKVTLLEKSAQQVSLRKTLKEKQALTHNEPKSAEPQTQQNTR